MKVKCLLFVFVYCALYFLPGKKENYQGWLNADNKVDTVQPPSLSDLTGPWQLLIDDYLIDNKENIHRTYHPFTKNPNNPILVADKPWEGRVAYLYGTVLPNEEKNGYRMWYQIWRGEYDNLYATSKDGLNWIKPELGIVDFKGSKANNIFFRRTREDHLPQVIHTPWEKDPNHRYKLLNYDYGRTKPDHLISGIWGAYSADGIHWTDAAHNPVLKDPGDVGNFVWDSHTIRYIGYPKVFAPVRGFNRRAVGFSATRDFENWPSAQLILLPDEIDDRWVTLKDQRTEFYGLSAFPYESGYLGFLWIFHITDGKNDGPIYCEIVSSRDGINWVRQEPINGERMPILPLGPKNAWDQGMVFSTNHPLVENNIIKLWYGGSSVTHSAHDDSARSGIGLATLRKDGFASLDAAGVTGTITTKPLKNLHGSLFINANAGKGSIKVEVLSADGKVLPGFSSNECDVIHGDNTKLQVSWRTNKLLLNHPGKYRLRFILQNASLYSFMGGDSVDIADPVQPGEFRLSAAKFPPGDVPPAKKIELLNTWHLGPQFTLAAMVKTSNKKLTRLFSNYRGSGELVTGELLFDFDPTGKEINGLRFNVNGQSAMSNPLKFDDGKYHHLAVTYDKGKVIFYLDGKEAGQAKLQLGAAHLFSDKSVRRYFEQPNALPEVGIHLGGNLCLGSDIGGRFVTYKDEVIASPQAQFTGVTDDVLVIQKVLTSSEILQLIKK
ncbi:MAG: LamG-like jellyroll fold domain-containing protein [Chitinophagaceae bacterium]